MTNKDAIKWLDNLTNDIGKTEHMSLWHYEQALYEIKTLLESYEDVVSKKAVIDAVHNSYDEILDFKSTGKTIAYSIEDIISEL